MELRTFECAGTYAAQIDTPRESQARIRPSRTCLIVFALWASTSSQTLAHQDASQPPQDVEEIRIIGRAQDLVGIAAAASMGRVGQDEIKRVPFLRPGEVLERIPGLIATQHSGTGKANQFFLRGFNLDHGTDFSTFLEGVPLNLPTHGHGQGYLDVNLLIPELIDLIEFRKGPYYADVGDFSSAGTSRIEYMSTIDRPFIKMSFGEFDFYRVVGGGSAKVLGGDLMLGGEVQFYNGPWDLREDLEKFNGIGKWTLGDSERGMSLFASGYSADWNSTDQIARRAVRDGTIGRFGNLDSDLGGTTSRYTATAKFWNGLENTTRGQLYASTYDFDLWSNFTYFLDDPDNGDQFQQRDKRTVLGLELTQDIAHDLASRHIHHTFGLQLRNDRISDVGLYNTVARQRRATVREDGVEVTTLGMFWKGDAHIMPWMRAYVGLRGDLYWFDVNARTEPANSGNRSDGIVTPKVGLAFGPWYATELYANYGRGFHSNDARGTTIRVDPVTGEAADRVDPLVSTNGAEIGTRTTWIPGLQSTLALWWLELDSELLFVGDAGNTEASRPSRRYGLEFANYWRALDWLYLDADVTFTHSEFRDSDADDEGDKIPGALRTTVAAGGAVEFENGLFGSLRVRHFGSAPLIEDNSARSSSTTVANMQLGYEWLAFPWGDMIITLDILNLFDSRDNDITYFYASRLPNEPEEGVEDFHFHPVEPLMFRGSLTWRF